MFIEPMITRVTSRGSLGTYGLIQIFVLKIKIRLDFKIRLDQIEWKVK